MELQRDLKAAMEKAGIPVPQSEERWGKALDALKVRACLCGARARLVRSSCMWQRRLSWGKDCESKQESSTGQGMGCPHSAHPVPQVRARSVG